MTINLLESPRHPSASTLSLDLGIHWHTAFQCVCLYHFDFRYGLYLFCSATQLLLNDNSFLITAMCASQGSSTNLWAVSWRRGLIILPSELGFLQASYSFPSLRVKDPGAGRCQNALSVP